VLQPIAIIEKGNLAFARTLLEVRCEDAGSRKTPLTPKVEFARLDDKMGLSVSGTEVACCLEGKRNNEMAGRCFTGTHSFAPHLWDNEPEGYIFAYLGRAFCLAMRS